MTAKPPKKTTSSNTTVVPADQATKAIVEQIRTALGYTLAHIPDITTIDEGAELWLAAKDIAADLSIIKRDVANRIIDISPTRIIQRGKEGEREVPVKDQHIDGVGTVTITNTKVRDWGDPVELINNMLEWWPSTHDGEVLRGGEIVALIAKLFPLGDLRVTALRDIEGLAERYEQEPWVSESYKDTLQVVVK